MTRLLLIATILLALFHPLLTPEPVPTAGIGVCHWIPPNPDGFTWAYETSIGRGVTWTELEPRPGWYDFRPLDAFMAEMQGKGVRVWAGLQTSDVDLYGRPKAPLWLRDMGAEWHTGACSKTGMFAPWDPIYLDRLGLLLRELGQHIHGNPALYAPLAGIVMPSGGPYGELQLWSCSMSETLQRHYGLTEPALLSLYVSGVTYVLDLHMHHLDLPIMFQLGLHRTPAELHAQRQLVWYAVDRYPDRIMLKWNGWDPGALALPTYHELYQDYASEVQVEEIGRASCRERV